MKAKKADVTNAVEPEAVRRYRYLLLTGEKSSLVELHASGLGALSGDERARVLQVVQNELVAGQRTRPDDAGGIARLAVAAEKRRAGLFRQALPPDLLTVLSAAVVEAARATSLLDGYAEWDGADPAPPPEWEAAKDHHTKWHDARLRAGVPSGEGYGGGF